MVPSPSLHFRAHITECCMTMTAERSVHNGAAKPVHYIEYMERRRGKGGRDGMGWEAQSVS